MIVDGLLMKCQFTSAMATVPNVIDSLAFFVGQGGWVEGPASRPVCPAASVGGWVVDRFGQVWSQLYQIVESKKFCVQNDISKPITGLWLLLLSLLDILVALMALSPTFSGQNYFSGKPASESISCENFYRSPVSGFETKSRIQKYTALGS